MQALPSLCVILLFCCVRSVVSGNDCPAGTFNHVGMKCDDTTTWKFAEDYPACVGALTGDTKDYNDAHLHCFDQQGVMLLPTSIAQNDALQTWRKANSAEKETWLSGQRVQARDWECSDGIGVWRRHWARWNWMHFAKDPHIHGTDPWDSGEPKSFCWTRDEHCFSMNTNGKWRDRECGDRIYGLCQKDHFACHACSTTACAAGQYRTSCPAGGKVDSTCETCGAGAACTANNRKRMCTGSETDHQCIACNARPALCAVTPGKWWKACDTAKFEDDSGCMDCLEATCTGNRWKKLCSAGGIAQGRNDCVNCLLTVCGHGEFFTPCNPLTDQSDTASCTICGDPKCGAGTYRKTCTTGQKIDTCPLCRTDICGIGFFRARCDGSQLVDAQCQACTDTIVCLENQYKILCDGVLNGIERDSSSCVPCPQNSGSPAGSTSLAACQCIADHVIVPPNNVCQICGLGTVKEGTTCNTCAAGSQRLAGASGCTPCPAGQYKQAEQLLCLSCGIGKYRVAQGATAETDCIKCAAGKFSAAVGAGTAGTCQDCPKGTQCPEAGMSVGQSCAEGNATNTVGSILCAECKIGTFSAGPGNHVCTNCVAGNFQNLAKQNSCKQCASGTVSPGPAATACDNCVAGKISAGNGRSVCTDCVAGTFQNLAQQSTCKTCEPGNVSPGSAASQCAPCVPGKIMAGHGGLQCADCESHKGLYAPGHGASVCTTCPDGGHESLSTFACTQCPAGKYKQSNSQSRCSTCQAVRSALSAQDGGIAPSPASDRCTPCKWYEYWVNTKRCEMCAPGTFLDTTQVPVACSPCSILDSGYCDRITAEMLGLSLFTSSTQESTFKNMCQQTPVVLLSNNAHANPLCPGCGCSLFRDAIRENEAPACATVANPRLYFDGQIRSCRFCPVNKNINNHVSRRSCDASDGTKHTEWDENTGTSRCVPGYRQTLANPPCVACEVGTYQDEVGATSCTPCPGNTTTPNQASISRHDCAWCSFHQRVVQNADTGAFSCRDCELCSVIRQGMHMLSSCTPCTYYEYDPKLPKHPPTCVLALCLDKVRTDGFQSTFEDDQFGLISKKDKNRGQDWNEGFIYMFVTELQWKQRMNQQPWSQRQDDLQSLDVNFQQTRMFSGMTGFEELEAGFLTKRNAGTPIYISFKDLFFRIFMQMALLKISFRDNIIMSDWNGEMHDGANDWLAYGNRIQQTGTIYMALDKNHSLVSAGHHGMAFSVAPSGTPLACHAVGAQKTELRIFEPSSGASFSITVMLVFAGVPVTASHCLAGSECGKMFLNGNDLIMFNNTHARIEFEHFHMFLLEDISFDITAATGINVLDFELSTPQVLARRRLIKMAATLYWRRKDTTYKTCSRSHSAAKHAVITDPVEFTQIQQAFRHNQCTNVDYV